MEPFLLEHLKDLSRRSERQGCFVFSDFLTPEEQSALHRIKKEIGPFSLFGGVPGAERQMARFGDPAELGYEEDFPIACVRISPLTLLAFAFR